MEWAGPVARASRFSRFFDFGEYFDLNMASKLVKKPFLAMRLKILKLGLFSLPFLQLHGLICDS